MYKKGGHWWVSYSTRVNLLFKVMENLTCDYHIVKPDLKLLWGLLRLDFGLSWVKATKIGKYSYQTAVEGICCQAAAMFLEFKPQESAKANSWLWWSYLI